MLNNSSRNISFSYFSIVMGLGIKINTPVNLKYFTQLSYIKYKCEITCSQWRPVSCWRNYCLALHIQSIPCSLSWNGVLLPTTQIMDYYTSTDQSFCSQS
ncbi:hypothetical protein WN944_006250 [Citrus x changshan-huyou]|uniref:Uncharacterized protein n=1 Tax=Citrus x changshan-huyou TaxID=2935761 RepID=A0AAP0QX13_9ROSI